MSTLAQDTVVAFVPLIIAGDQIATCTPATEPDGTISLGVNLPAGLHQLSVVVDASMFDWEELYTVLNMFGNDNVRTGPWDFSLLKQSAPLVPSYWVSVDGKRLGLWFFQRVTLEDIAAKRFRGRMAFHIAQAGQHKVSLTPYRPMNIRWLSARLEPDPEDRLDPLPGGVGNAGGKIYVSKWAKPEFWADLKQKVKTTHAVYAEPLERAYDWVLARSPKDPINIALLLAAHHLGGRAEALNQALEVIDAYIERPSFGNPKEDGYSHNCDMGAAYAIRGLAFAYHMLGEQQLGAERTQKLLAKVQKHAEIFFDLALINRDYWGGSVLQDHGFSSFMHYAAAVLAMRGVLPDAERWCRLAVTRVFRSIDAMPTEGVLPMAGYACPWMFPPHTAFFRDTLLSMGGPDVYAHPTLRGFAPALLAVYHPATRRIQNPHPLELMGGNAFFAGMAAANKDGVAAYIHEQMVTAPKEVFYHPNNEYAFFHSTIWGLISFDPSVKPTPPKSPRRQLTYFQDAGLVHYSDETTGATIALQCGPWCGYNAYRKAQGPCDRMTMNVGQGHFVVYINGQQRLLSPDGGYRLRSAVTTTMLVDGNGQYGDIGYPMSIPSFPDRGAEVQFTRWDPATFTGLVRLNLGPAYTPESGIISYTREFRLAPQRRIVVRDSVVLDRPRKLSWLFQGKREFGVAVDAGLRSRFGLDNFLYVEPELAQGHEANLALDVSIQNSPVVFGYSSGSGFKPFDHARYDTRGAVQTATVDFVLTW